MNMLAAPNQTKIQFKILDVQQDHDVENKYNLVIKVIPSPDQTDERFIKPDQIYEAFTFDLSEDIQPLDIRQSEAEYIGGADDGRVLLKEVI